MIKLISFDDRTATSLPFSRPFSNSPILLISCAQREELDQGSEMKLIFENRNFGYVLRGEINNELPDLKMEESI